MDILFAAILILIAAFLFFSAITSFREKEAHAGKLLIVGFIGFLSVTLIPQFFLEDTELFKLLVILIVALIAILFFFPTRRNSIAKNTGFGNRFHEADTVLSRRKLESGTPKYDAYYKQHPDYKKGDDKARKNPGLLSERSRYYDPVTFSAAGANFVLTGHLHELQDFPPSNNKETVDKKKITSFIEKWMLKTGAHSIGFTSLEDHHLYSHKGRGKQEGEQILKDLPYAIAITVEMDFYQMKYAPAGPTVMESSEQYLRSGVMATKLALFIKEMGYQAKAHIDGNYEVICPLLAADAGLGVIGRMGLLMTPRLGPRVRIAVVTTDLPVEFKQKNPDTTAIDFCAICKKCASVCPVNAIPSGSMREVEGSLKWKIDSESCYNYWTLAGTDCGRCVISCPYSHPDNGLHGFIRWGIKNNLLFRRMAVKLDDIFYGRKPSIRELPDWLTFTKQK